MLYTIGNLTVDDIVMYDGRVWVGQAGGDALYSALGALVWGAEVGLIARVGDDLPAAYREELDALGLELLLMPAGRPNIRHWALYEADGSRQFVRHRSSGSYDELSLRAAELPPTPGTAGYHIAALPTERQLELVRALRPHAALITLDPHIDYIVGHETTIQQLLGLVDVFLPSRVEARLLVGRDDPADAARACAAGGARVVVVKLGAEGALVYQAASGSLTHVPACPVNAADTTGAGDAFCGGFLARYAARRDAVDAACYGTVAASFIVERIGAIGGARINLEERHARLRALRDAVDAGAAHGGVHTPGASTDG